MKKVVVMFSMNEVKEEGFLFFKKYFRDLN